MLIAGGAFASAVFATYLLMGMGALKFLSFLNEFSVIAKCVYLLAAIRDIYVGVLEPLRRHQSETGKGERDVVAVAEITEVAYPQSYPRADAHIGGYHRCVDNWIRYFRP